MLVLFIIIVMHYNRIALILKILKI